MKCNLETITKALLNHQEQQHAVSFSKLKAEIDGFKKELIAKLHGNKPYGPSPMQKELIKEILGDE